MRASELQYVLDTIERFFDQSDAGVCVARSYGLAVVGGAGCFGEALGVAGRAAIRVAIALSSCCEPARR